VPSETMNWPRYGQSGRCAYFLRSCPHAHSGHYDSEPILARDGTASPSKPTHSKISSTIQVSASPSARVLGYIINESLS
jgi:hypothetical protein